MCGAFYSLFCRLYFPDICEAVSHTELEALQQRFALFLSAATDRTSMDRGTFKQAFSQLYMPWSDDDEIQDALFNVRGCVCRVLAVNFNL